MIGRGTFALVERSLRVETRMARTHLVRLIFALLILVLLVHVQLDIDSYSTPGSDVFQRICWLNFFLLNLAGLSFFATVITEEKEEMTLGLLRMAGISSAGVLLGKVSPRLIGAALLLSVQMPFTLLSITLGGVTQEQVIAAYAGLLSYAVLLAGLGALLSTICSRSNVASSLMTGLLTAFYIGPLMLQSLTNTAQRRGWLSTELRAGLGRFADAFEDASLWTALERINSTSFRGPLIGFQTVFSTVTGLICLLTAWALFDVCTRNEKPAAPPRGLMALFSKRLASLGLGARVWDNALAWKDFNFMTGGLTALLIKLLAYGVLMGGASIAVSRQVRTEFRDTAGATIMFSTLTALAVEVPMYLSRLFREELRWQTWPGLVLLPHSVGWVAKNKLLGTLPAFIPSAVLFLIGAILAPGFLTDFLEKAFLTGIGWCVLTQFVLMQMVIVLLSLSIKWGALPMGIAVVVTGNLIWFAVSFRLSPAAMYGVPIAVAVVACGLLPLAIGRRLEQLAEHG